MRFSQPSRHFGLTLVAVILAPILFAACGGGTSEGAAPAAKTAAPAAATQAVAAPAAPPKIFLILDGDTVRTGEALTAEEKPILDCVQANRFPQGGGIEFRFKVWDALTGKTLDDKSMKSVVVTLGNGTKVPLAYKGRPNNNPTDFFWREQFKVPLDFPTGAFLYQVDAVDNEGRTGTYKEFNVKPTQVVIVAKGQR